MGILDKIFGRSQGTPESAPAPAATPAARTAGSGMSQAPKAKLGTISAKETKARMDAGDDFVLVDVREDGEREICKIDGAVHIPLGQITSRYNELPKDKEIILHCHHGMRSQAAGFELLNVGFTKVTNLTGGIDAWSLEVDPAVKRY